MGVKVPYDADIKAEALKAHMANAPKAIDIAERICLSPTELRDLVHEAALLLDGKFSENGVPVMAHPPEALKHMTPQELRLLLGIYPEARLH